MNASSTSDKGVRAMLRKEPALRIYMIGQLVSLTGSLLQNQVMSNYLTNRFGSTIAYGKIGTVWLISCRPAALCGPLVGPLFARHTNKKFVMQASALCGGIQALLFGLVLYLNLKTPMENVYGLVLLGGLINAVDIVVRQAYISYILKDRSLPNQQLAQISFQTLYNFGIVVGGGCAGYIVKHAGYSLTFTLNAVSYAALMLAIKYIPASPAPSTDMRSVFGSVIAGGRQLFANVQTRTCLVLAALSSALGFAYFQLLSPIMQDAFGGDYQAEASKLMASVGSGMLVSSPLVLGYSHTHPRRMVFIGLSGVGISLISATCLHASTYMCIPFFWAGVFVTMSMTTLVGLLYKSAGELQSVAAGYRTTVFLGAWALSAFLMSRCLAAFGWVATLRAWGTCALGLCLIIPFIRSFMELTAVPVKTNEVPSAPHVR